MGEVAAYYVAYCAATQPPAEGQAILAEWTRTLQQRLEAHLRRERAQARRQARGG